MASSLAREGRMSLSTSAPFKAAASSRSRRAIASSSRLSKGRKGRRPPTSPRRSSGHSGSARRSRTTNAPSSRGVHRFREPRESPRFRERAILTPPISLMASRTLSASTLEPMYASVGATVPTEPGWTYEPKYDGMRALAFIAPARVRLMTRNGKDKAKQFPEITAALGILARQLKRPCILDGEVVALERNRPGHFQALQGRFHLKGSADIEAAAREAPAVLIAFDILLDGNDKLLTQPLTRRRKRLERLLRNAPEGVRISQSSPNGPRMVERAQKGGWEGVIAKRGIATYVPGARSRDWLKLKLQHRAEFVIGGFTEPRRTRPYLGALLLGYFDSKGRLHHVGHTGGGFNRESLRELREQLDRIERDTSPFADT